MMVMLSLGDGDGDSEAVAVPGRSSVSEEILLPKCSTSLEIPKFLAVIRMLNFLGGKV